MKNTLIVVGIIVGIIVLVALMAIIPISKKYNTMVTNSEQVDSQWAQVQNVYQRRTDLIPNLVNTVKGFAQQEKDVLIGVTEARAKATSTTIDAGNLTPVDEQLHVKIRRLEFLEAGRAADESRAENDALGRNRLTLGESRLDRIDCSRTFSR